MPTISIITPVLNGEQTIASTLESILGQDIEPHEIIVVDGQSTDRTAAVVKSMDSPLIRFVSKKDESPYEAINRGIQLATGDIVAVLNADDAYISTSVLSQVTETFADDPALEGVYADLVYVDRESASRICRFWRASHFRLGALFRGWLLPRPTFFVRRDVFARCGMYDLRYKLHAEFDLIVRLLEIHRIRVRYIPEIFVKMRVGGRTNRDFATFVKGHGESFRVLRQITGSSFSFVPFFLGKILHRVPQLFARPGRPLPPQVMRREIAKKVVPIRPVA